MATEGEGTEPRSAHDEPIQADAVTRGFLFSDLRGYTEFVEQRGAPAAAQLLERYRTLVRAAIRRFGGAEIKTEGDSFYVVFNSVTTAVRAGLAVTAAARESSAQHPHEPIHVGIGIHAGETVETAEGYVGSPVNIAARICSKAIAGEVLVSDTVRALTRTLLPVRFEPRGRPQLKGVTDSIALFCVVATDGISPGPRPRHRARRRALTRRQLIAGGAVAGGVMVAAIAGWFISRPGPGLPPGPWKIGLEMPLTGPGADGGIPIRLAVQLAIDDVNRSGGTGGTQLELAPYDDFGDPDDLSDPEKAAANTRAMVADPRIVGTVGPFGSHVAPAVIPVSNEGGLLICSPASTEPSLTKLRLGAADLRKAHPDRNAFVRLAPADDIQPRALASFAIRDLGAKAALVIDDARHGPFLADGFAAEFTKLGGKADRRSLAYVFGADPHDALQPWSVGTATPDVVFWGGDTETGGAALRIAMADLQHASTALISWDGLLDGPGSRDGTYIQRTKANAVGTFISHASLPLPRADFADHYRQVYGDDPGEYVAAGHACTEVIVSALRAIAAVGTTAGQLREAVRAHVTDPQYRYQTPSARSASTGTGTPFSSS